MSETANKRNYRVLINGRNFLLSMDGKVRKTGFYTTRFVEAQNAEQAAVAAIELIKGDPKLLNIVVNKREVSPVMNVEEIEEITTLRPQVGYAFYSEEEDAVRQARSSNRLRRRPRSAVFMRTCEAVRVPLNGSVMRLDARYDRN